MLLQSYNKNFIKDQAMVNFFMLFFLKITFFVKKQPLRDVFLLFFGFLCFPN